MLQKMLQDEQLYKAKTVVDFLYAFFYNKSRKIEIKGRSKFCIPFFIIKVER